jgi:putative addiction module component (TIGR02574 family)
VAQVKKPRDSMPAANAAISLTDAQRAELDRRAAEHEANPDDVVVWSEIRTSIIDRLKA